jgi:outer membrane protein OmpU
MKKFLLAGCAAAVLGMGANGAIAQDFKVRISGKVEFQAVFAEQDFKANTRSVDFRNRFRLIINPEAVALDGALTYGAVGRIVTEDKTGAAGGDRAFVYVQGAFGTIKAGTINSYNDENPLSAPSDWRAPENAMLAALAFVNASNDRYGKTASGLSAWRWGNIIATGSNTKLRYNSPIVKGLQFAAGYTPSAPGIEKGYNTGWTFNREKSGLTDTYELGLRFDSANKTFGGAFGDYVLQAGANYHGGKVRDTALVALNDLSAFQAGLRVGYGGFKIGAGYMTYGKSGLYKTDKGQVNAYTWRLGAQYATGPWTLGVGYDSSQKDVDFDSGTTHANDRGEKKTANQFEAGLTYTVAKGLELAGGYHYITTKNTYSHLKDKAHAVVLTTSISF